MTKDEALKMRKEQDEYWSKIIKQVEQQETWRHDCMVMGYGWTTWENGCRHCGQSAPSWFNKEKHMTTYEQPLAWMQKLTSEVDGTKITRHTFTKDRIGVNDIPVYIQNENGNYSPKHQWQEPVEVYGILDDGDYVSVEATKDGAIKHCEFMNKHDCNCTYKPLYTHPHQWQGLTDDVVASIWMHEAVPMNGQDFKRVYRAIEQALKEKNHG